MTLNHPRQAKAAAWSYLIRNALLATIALLLCGIIALQLWTSLATRQAVAAIRETQVTNTATSRSTHDNTVIIKALQHQFTDCVKPGGACYQRSQERTKATLNIAGHLFIYAVKCGRNHKIAGNLPALENCFDRLAAQHGLN